MIVTAQIFTKLLLARKILVKNYCTELKSDKQFSYWC